MTAGLKWRGGRIEGWGEGMEGSKNGGKEG